MACGYELNGQFLTDQELRDYIASNKEAFQPYITGEIALDSSIDYELKAAKILASDEAIQKFKRGDKAGWTLEKILTELQIPASQKALLLTFGTRNREELLENLLSNYTYTVRTEISKDTPYFGEEELNEFTRGQLEEFGINPNDREPPLMNTQHYSNMTVPGGTNYTENEIFTPRIIPSIKGHAQFSTDKGIGWFRSDDQVNNTTLVREGNPEKQKNLIELWGDDPRYKELLSHDIVVYNERGAGNASSSGGILFDKTTSTEYYLHPEDMEPLLLTANKIWSNSYLDREIGGELTKTRRILEVQSDLFQKGRDRLYLTNVDDLGEIKFSTQFADYSILAQQVKVKHENGYEESFSLRELGGRDDEQLIKYKIEEYKRNIKFNKGENTFLQLLNKDNNWVSFFIKSIIQDSAKKGYEKVLFPSGNTANKIEGQETLEGYIKTREDLIKSDEELLDKINNGKNFVYAGSFYDTERKTIDDEENRLFDEAVISASDTIKRRLDNWKRELNNAIEGRGGFGSINRFYETDIQNILNKRGYNPTRIKDEHGNEWFEVEIKPEHEGRITLDSSISDLEEGLKQAATDQTKFESQLQRIIDESSKVQKVINKIKEESVRSKLRDSLRYIKDNNKELKNFVYFLLEAQEVLKFYAEDLKKIRNLPIEDAIAQLSAADIISKSFKDMITFLKKDFRYVDESNQFKKLVNDIANYYDQIQNIYTSEAEVLSVEVMKQELEPDAKESLTKLQAELNNIREQVGKATNAGAKASYIKGLQDKEDQIKKRIQQLVPDAQNIEDSFKGLRGDLNWFSGNFRSALSMGDPIISGYSRRIKRGYNQVRAAMTPIRNQAQNQLSDYVRGTGVNPRQSMAEFYKDLYQIEKVDNYDDNGETTTSEYYALVGPVNQQFYNDDLKFRNSIRKARQSGDQKALQDAQKEYSDWLNQYAERQYVEAWYDRYELLTPEAYEERQKIIDQINNILRGPNRDSLSDTDLEVVADLKYKLKRLGSTRDDKGELKTGKDLEIAQSMQAFNKKTAEMSYWETTDENKRWFNIILNKKKEQVQKGLITQEDFDRWFSANTQRNISQEFYKQRQVIIDKIQGIMSKLPKDEFKQNIKDLWNSIFDISRPYRDEDNILVGSDFTASESTAVKSNEEAIEEIKAKLIKFSGLTLEEERELQGLWGAIDSLSDSELQRFVQLRQKSSEYKDYLGQYISKIELNSLFSYFGQLAEISKWEPTTYYTSTYNQKLHEFRIKVDPNMLKELSLIEAQFKAEDQWYKDNHITKTKKSFQDGKVFFTEEEEPIYIWRDIIPTNPDWVQQDAPGFAFKTRIVKPEYINSNYENLNFEYFKITDPDEFRTVPKRVVNEEGEVKMSSYINENYERLRRSQDPKDQAKFSMLQFLINTHLLGQQKLPTYKRLGYFLPGVVKSRYDRTLEQGFKGVKNEIFDSFRITQEDKDLTLGDLSQIDLSIIPVKFSTKVKPEDQDLDLLGSILKHRMGIEEYSYLEKELPYAKVIQSSLRTAPNDVSQSQIDRVLKYFGFDKFIKATKESQRSKTFDSFVRTMFYGETEVSPFNSARTNKILNNAFGIATLQVMTFNFPAHITNILSGEVQNVIESSAGKYMTWKDYIKAKSIYLANLKNFWDDYTKEGNKSFWTALAEELDVPQGDFTNELGNKVRYSRVRDLKNHVMFIKQGGEHEIQISTMIAMTLNYKVKMGDKMVSLNEALELKDGKIKIKDGAQLTEADINKFQDRVQSVVRALNGAYSKIDKSVAEKAFLGKLFFYMRKYLLPMAYRRFEPYKYDYEEQDFKEGYYQVVWRILKDIAKLNTSMVNNWDTYNKSFSELEKRNVRRFAAEMTIIGILALSIMMLGGYDDDRDLKGRWLYAMGLYELMKVKSETETFIPLPTFGLDELSNTFSSPFVPATTAKTTARFAKDLVTWSRYKKDYGIWEEGDLRLKADALKLLGIPVNLATPELMVKNFELRNR